MRKVNTILGLVALLCVIGFVAAAWSINSAAKASGVEKKVAACIAAIEEELHSLPASIQTSSNPYDYIKELKQTESLIALGHDALPFLEQHIDQSEGSGLTDYILADTAETIAKINLKNNQQSSWETGDAFSAQWKALLKNTPAKVNEITSLPRPDEEKIRSLVELGVPALPFIVEEIEAGRTGLLPALQILSGDGSLPAQDQISAEWIQEQKVKYEGLKKYVLGKG